jgi:RND family efflux transporter MFP subunit
MRSFRVDRRIIMKNDTNSPLGDDNGVKRMTQIGRCITWKPAILALAALVLAACDDRAPAPQPEVARPAQIITLGAADLGSGLRFPGRVRAVKRAELAFDVPGRIVEFPVTEGQRLAAGELIAALDPQAFKLQLDAARAQYDKARADYERVEKVWRDTQAVARAEVDQKRTAMDVARSRYAAARKDFEDTRLTAPFDGVLTRRYVENFQAVQAKEPVASVQDLSELEVVIYVPERIVQGAPRRVAGEATFEGIPGRRFPVTLKSFSSEADPQTQTYEVVLTLTRPQDVTILPGMAAEVFPVASAGEGEQALLVPMKAIFAGPDGGSRVWVVDDETSRVSQRPVQIGEVTDEGAVVTAGLVPGERIVTAGISHLRDAMLVRPL